MPAIYTIRFEVVDSGVGMTPDQIKKIFTPFEQVGDVTYREKGTGLGLSISQRLVNIMGGTIQVKSEIGMGSTFWFDIDLPASNEEYKPTEKRTQGSIIGYQGAQRKVLVVDDKSYNRSIIYNLLTPLGFEVIEAEDGQDGVEKAQELQPDFILMDLVMPRLTGFEATRIIRQMPHLSQVAIVASSASVFEVDKEQSVLAGCNAFLSKPIDVEKFFDVLQTSLDLEWIYEGFKMEQVAGEIDEINSDTGELISPPAEDINALLEFVMAGNMIAVEEYVEHLEQGEQKFKSFAKKARQLARSFEEDELIKLLQAYRE
jgi:CheY-like chemotaxis protein